MTDKLIALSTCGSLEDGERLSKALVEGGFAACVNILRNIRSIFRWQGELEDEDEVLLLIKTTREAFPALKEELLRLHPYDNPELLAVSVEDGAAAYLKWVEENVTR